MRTIREIDFKNECLIEDTFRHEFRRVPEEEIKQEQELQRQQWRYNAQNVTKPKLTLMRLPVVEEQKKQRKEIPIWQRSADEIVRMKEREEQLAESQRKDSLIGPQ